MPRRTIKRRKLRGAGFGSFLKKAAKFLHKTKLISRAGNALGALGVPHASRVGNFAGSVGLGRQRKGSGLRLSGGRRATVRRRRR